MDRDRIEISELETIKQLSQVFTPNIWDTAVFALTFANRVIPPLEMETDEEVAEWFKERIKQFQEVIVRSLAESGVRHDKAKEVPVIPTGYHKPTRQMPKPRELYDRPDWFNPFWQSCINHTEETAQTPLLASQKHCAKSKTISKQEKELTNKQQELEKREKEQLEMERELSQKEQELKKREKDLETQLGKLEIETKLRCFEKTIT